MSQFTKPIGVFILLALAFAGGWALNHDQRPLNEDNLRGILLPAPFRAEPTAFQAFPCTPNATASHPLAPCVLVSAGGKRLVFGMPTTQDWRGIGKLDAAFVLHDHPRAFGGVVPLRSEHWQQGSDKPLLVIAGDLQVDYLKSLDALQAGQDAILHAEANGRLSFARTLLLVRPVPANATRFKVFDTGDLQVFATSYLQDTGSQTIGYDIVYNDRNVRIQGCGTSLPTSPVQSLLLPIVEANTLSALKQYAVTERHQAGLAEIERMAAHCANELDLVSFKSQNSVTSIVKIAGLDTNGALPDTSRLSSNGVDL